jgi:tellurite methyltransferase
VAFQSQVTWNDRLASERAGQGERGGRLCEWPYGLDDRLDPAGLLGEVRTPDTSGSTTKKVGWACSGSGSGSAACHELIYDIEYIVRAMDFFDEKYRSTGRYWWSGVDRYSTRPEDYPHSLLTQWTLRLLYGDSASRDGYTGRVLDLGAGEGADSIRLALLGYQVDAIDVSEMAIRKIHHFAAEKNVRLVTPVRADVREFRPDIQYDVVLCKGLLHYVEAKEPVVRMMQEATAPGGINVVSLWSSFTEVPEPHRRVDTFCDDEDGEVENLYRNWPRELIYYERDKPESAHSDMPPHSHSHIKLIARKRW